MTQEREGHVAGCSMMLTFGATTTTASTSLLVSSTSASTILLLLLLPLLLLRLPAPAPAPSFSARIPRCERGNDLKDGYEYVLPSYGLVFRVPASGFEFRV